MRVYMLGDFSSDNGPGQANAVLKDGLVSRHRDIEYLYSTGTVLVMRFWENVYKTAKADIVLVADFTRLHFVSLFVAKMLKKKVVYRAHGHIAYEMKINKPGITKREYMRERRIEKIFYDLTDKIVCVSKLSADKLSRDYPDCIEKITYCYNAIERMESSKKLKSREHIKSMELISVGGGMKQKNILEICKAVRKYNAKNKVVPLKLIVIGESYGLKEEICKFDFVEYHDRISHDELLFMMSHADLYVQDSTFETFGLSALEALTCGCSILISRNMGLCEIIDGIANGDLIDNVANDDEICDKISNLLLSGNSDRLASSIRWDLISKEHIADWFYDEFQILLKVV